MITLTESIEISSEVAMAWLTLFSKASCSTAEHHQWRAAVDLAMPSIREISALVWPRDFKR